MSAYDVYVIPKAWAEIGDLPGHMRQRVRRAVDALARHPRPEESQCLSAPESEYEVRRIRLDRWRIVYAITETDRIIDVLAVRRRPPYDYGDLDQLMAEAR